MPSRILVNDFYVYGSIVTLGSRNARSYANLGGWRPSLHEAHVAPWWIACRPPRDDGDALTEGIKVDVETCGPSTLVRWTPCFRAGQPGIIRSSVVGWTGQGGWLAATPEINPVSRVPCRGAGGLARGLTPRCRGRIRPRKSETKSRPVASFIGRRYVVQSRSLDPNVGSLPRPLATMIDRVTKCQYFKVNRKPFDQVTKVSRYQAATFTTCHDLLASCFHDDRTRLGTCRRRRSRGPPDLVPALRSGA